ncbi:MAG: isoaspartyl peptidase/L-asparaginase family protein [candidate division WOR-3 bacterium]
MARKAIIVNGGAGPWKAERLDRALLGVKKAVLAGWRVLVEGGSALDATIEAVVEMEDDPVFNAGTGSCLNTLGFPELEALVMRGDTLEAGAVAGAPVKNPVRLARLVMEKTDHVILFGEGARMFARAMGFEEYDPVIPERVETYKEMMARLREGKSERWRRLPGFVREHPEFMGDTVGAVAVDESGVCAVATSTGGVFLKMPGRMGDSPIPGAGNYAGKAGAISLTGEGEGMIRTVAAKRAYDLLESGMLPDDVVKAVVKEVHEKTGKQCGIILVSADGTVASHYNTNAMPTSAIWDGLDEPITKS